MVGLGQIYEHFLRLYQKPNHCISVNKNLLRVSTEPKRHFTVLLNVQKKEEKNPWTLKTQYKH